jgi:hypothetical protein
MAFTPEDVQVRLKNLGFYGGKIDGDLGPASREAIMRALETLQPVVPVVPPVVVTPPGPAPLRLLKPEWLQPGTFSRVHLHWTAGDYDPSEFDKDHYHFLVDGAGRVVKGNCDVSANSTTAPKGKKSHHTLNANTGALSVSLACMGGNDVRERPYNGGKWPLKQVQWVTGAIITAELCKRYKIPVGPRSVLSHAEVEANLGIKQRGKWDIAILPWDMSYDTARECGDLYRKQVQAHLNSLGVA